MENVLFSNMKQEQKSYKEELRGNIQNEECDIKIRYISVRVSISKDVAEEWISEEEKIEELTHRKKGRIKRKIKWNKC